MIYESEYSDDFETDIEPSAEQKLAGLIVDIDGAFRDNPDISETLVFNDERGGQQTDIVLAGLVPHGRGGGSGYYKISLVKSLTPERQLLSLLVEKDREEKDLYEISTDGITLKRTTDSATKSTEQIIGKISYWFSRRPTIAIWLRADTLKQAEALRQHQQKNQSI